MGFGGQGGIHRFCTQLFRLCALLKRGYNGRGWRHKIFKKVLRGQKLDQSFVHTRLSGAGDMQFSGARELKLVSIVCASSVHVCARLLQRLKHVWEVLETCNRHDEARGLKLLSIVRAWFVH